VVDADDLRARPAAVGEDDAGVLTAEVVRGGQDAALLHNDAGAATPRGTDPDDRGADLPRKLPDQVRSLEKAVSFRIPYSLVTCNSQVTVSSTDMAAVEALDHALAAIGDRWTLLVVAALLDGPQRFGDLQETVPGIATNVLTQRLRALQERAWWTPSRTRPAPPATATS